MTSRLVAHDLAEMRRALGKAPGLSDAVILVTGCGGFLGFYLLHFLLGHAAEFGIRRVIGVDSFLINRPAWLDLLEREHPERFTLLSFNIATDKVESIPGAGGATHVIHMASIASPSFYRQFPLETIDANVWGLRRLLDFYAGSSSLKGFLFFSSSEVYGDPSPDNIPTPETYRGSVACQGPRACYDESKRFGETLCQVFAERSGVPVRIVRPFNNYGPGMRPEDKRLPADYARAVLEGRDIVILSDGRPTRTFCYITDAMTGYLKALLHGKFDTFNIGSDRPEISVRDFAELFNKTGAELFGYSGAVRHEKSSDADYLTDNPNRRCPDITKARRELGFAPGVSPAEGIRRYLAFLRDTDTA